jgi:hypothetical protein
MLETNSPAREELEEILRFKYLVLAFWDITETTDDADESVLSISEGFIAKCGIDEVTSQFPSMTVHPPPSALHSSPGGPLDLATTPAIVACGSR